ncbi:4'-phosphopantetheinyl transferase family protein [Dictyobacter aurantiacus]|uniref:4'-phosphopantetheinyl transferase n=1 Tax=Dictyobacter aurantiacus TaxID=1936993 RepID=A0A401Z7P8_9CHLR|nr:4'-phosphopantetheinyl transferase superfamily protein [Dictyobacter aurantiacus]GCE02872.1 4'-phosphopantetheinyl transferase [Dictyobacter aurantiacus]
MERAWTQSPPAVVLKPDEIHVWRVFVDEWLASLPQLRAFLSPDEQARAQKFYFERDRNCSIIARGVLRVLLGRYCALDPSMIMLCYNEFGKPDLASNDLSLPLYFNLAHSHTTIVYAFTYINRVGIDVEYMRTNIEYEELAEHYFSPVEKAQLQAMSIEQKMQAFFAGWTRKEAYIKARGKGLSIPLDSFDVTLLPDQDPRLLDCREDPQSVSHWTLYALPADPHYAGALALNGVCEHLQFWHLSPLF